MILREFFSKYIFGLVLDEDVPSVAANALVEGHDSPSLRMLAGIGLSDVDSVRQLVYKSMKELGIPVYSKEQAGLVLAHAIAKDVVDGRLDPYEGAKRIWIDIYDAVPSLAQLDSIVGMAGEYEDDEAHREAYADMMRMECRDLVRTIIV